MRGRKKTNNNDIRQKTSMNFNVTAINAIFKSKITNSLLIFANT